MHITLNTMPRLGDNILQILCFGPYVWLWRSAQIFFFLLNCWYNTRLFNRTWGIFRACFGNPSRVASGAWDLRTIAQNSSCWLRMVSSGSKWRIQRILKNKRGNVVIYTIDSERANLLIVRTQVRHLRSYNFVHYSLPGTVVVEQSTNQSTNDFNHHF